MIEYISLKDDLIYVFSIYKRTCFFKYFHLNWSFEEGLKGILRGITQRIVMISFIREGVLVKVNLELGPI